MDQKIQVLIVDDEPELRRTVSEILKSHLPKDSFNLEEVDNGKDAVELAAKKAYDFILMDVRMPELSGIEALEKIKEKSPQTFIVLMTAHANLNDAITSIRHGAYDYVEKPVSPEKLKTLLNKALGARELVNSLALNRPIFDDDIDSDFVGQSEKMKDIFRLINKLAKVETTVLIRGENGTGKELVARAIHFNSPVKSGPFIAINCGAIPQDLMESELFGHEKGAFTGAVERKIGKFQASNNGTLFLDEIAELKPEMQVKLLRVLQERSFVPVGSNREIKTNARIIAATNQNIEKMMDEGNFREDLFYRLNVMPLFLPPLRERTEDIPGLVDFFIKKFSKSHPESQIKGLDREASEALKHYRWPGNIRELENVIERAFIVESGELISLKSLPDAIVKSYTNRNSHPENLQEKSKNPVLDYEHFKEQAEKDFIIKALEANKGKINQTVAQAGIPKNTLLRKIKKYQINPDLYKEDA